MTSPEITIQLAKNTEWIDWLPIIVVILAAWFAARIAVRQLRQNTLTKFFEEISSTKASEDRGLLREKVNEKADIAEVEPLIKAVRANRKGTNRDIGEAFERTIARLDRVAVFLLCDVSKFTNYILLLRPFGLTSKPPIWLRTHIREVWTRAEKWVKYRQSEDSGKLHHEHYAYYLQKLAEYYNFKNQPNKKIGEI